MAIVAVECDLAGFSDSSGRIGGAVRCQEWLVPNSVTLKNGMITAAWLWERDGEPGEIEASKGMLNSFLRLRNANANAILAYASRWGLLGLDEDQQPIRSYMGRIPEPIEAWRALAGKFDEILRLAIRVRDESLSEADTKKFASVDPDDWNPEGIEAAREHIALNINHFLRLGSVVPRMHWIGTPGRYGLQLGVEAPDGGRPLLVALALQLMLAVSDMDRLALCSGCPQLIVARSHEARPSAGRGNYCDACKRQGRALQKADRRRKLKMIDARRLKSEGLSIAKIASTLDVKVESVKKWTEKTNVETR